MRTGPRGLSKYIGRRHLPSWDTGHGARLAPVKPRDGEYACCTMVSTPDLGWMKETGSNAQLGLESPNHTLNSLLLRAASAARQRVR